MQPLTNKEAWKLQELVEQALTKSTDADEQAELRALHARLDQA